MATDLSDGEVAGLLGKHPRTIQRWCQAGKLPGAYKAGRSWRIPQTALRRAQLGPALENNENLVGQAQHALAICNDMHAEANAFLTRGVRSTAQNWRRLSLELNRLAITIEEPPRPRTQTQLAPRTHPSTKKPPRYSHAR